MRLRTHLVEKKKKKNTNFLIENFGLIFLVAAWAPIALVVLSQGWRGRRNKHLTSASLTK